jgi:type I restriction enzyme M protein
LDISWLKDENADNNSDLPEPEILAQEAISELEAALGELREILKELGAEVFV